MKFNLPLVVPSLGIKWKVYFGIISGNTECDQDE
jgi:hypothetical protein